MSILLDSNVPTRMPTTELNYLRRAMWFEECASRMMNSDNVSPLEVAACAIEQKTSWARSTWRQIKSALIYRYECMGTENSAKAVMLLKSESQEGAIKRANRSSALRKKNITDDEMRLVVETVRACRSSYSEVLGTWLVLGAVFGLRPHEWTKTTLVNLSQADIEGRGDAVVKRPYLRIENGKNSNGRTHGKYRHLNLENIPDEVVAGAVEFAIFMSSLDANNEYDKYYAGCQKLLARVNLRLGYSGKKRIQLYSPRHKFAANAKTYLNLQSVGALMGHSSDRTATFHYAKKRRASGGIAVKPLSSEVMRVKQKKEALPSFIASKQISKNTSNPT